MVELKVSGITIIAIVLSSMLAKFYGVLLVCEINIVKTAGVLLDIAKPTGVGEQNSCARSVQTLWFLSFDNRVLTAVSFPVILLQSILQQSIHD